MKIILLIILILELIFLIGCKGVKNKSVLNKNTISFTEFPKEKDLTFENFYEYKNGNIMAIYLADSILVFMNEKSGIDYFFNSYSLRNGNLSEGFLKKGRGPNEVLGVRAAGFFANCFWVYDITLKKILITNKIKTFKNSLFKEYPVNEFFYDMDFIDTLSYLTVGDNESSYKIVRRDLNSNKKIDEYGPFEKINFKSNIATIKDAFSCNIHVKPSGGKFALSYRYTDIIEIFDIDMDTNIAIQGPICFTVEYEEGNRNGYFFMQKTKKTRKAFINGTVTDNFIYLLYSGHLYQDENWSYSNYLFVYDWDGNVVQRIILDRFVYTVAVSADDKTIYSYDKESGFVICGSLN
jgi:hypothetical protein